MAKRMQKPKGFHVDGIADVYSVSSCINDDFADYIEYWKHNGHWLLIHPRSSGTWQRKILLSLAKRPSFTTKCTIWSLMVRVGVPYGAEPSVPTNVVPPQEKVLEGFDVVTFYAKNAPECSPLSCNRMAEEIRTNRHCLLESFGQAYDRLNEGAFNNAEPGPYRIFTVYSVEWPRSPR